MGVTHPSGYDLLLDLLADLLIEDLIAEEISKSDLRSKSKNVEIDELKQTA